VLKELGKLYLGFVWWVILGSKKRIRFANWLHASDTRCLGSGFG